MTAVLWIVAGPHTLQAEVDALKRLQAEPTAGKTLELTQRNHLHGQRRTCQLTLGKIQE